MYFNSNEETSFINDYLITPKLSEILDSCERSEKLIISVSTVKCGTLLYYNRPFHQFIGCTNENKISDKNWQFGCCLVDLDELDTIETKLKEFYSNKRNQNILSLKYHIQTLCGKRLYIKHESILFNLENEDLVLNYYYDISEKEVIERIIEVNTRCNFMSYSSISVREQEVLKLIANGYSSKQIADQLYISNHTAISHRKHLIKKFDVKNTAQLIKEASKVIEL